ncbi:type II secretion system protein [Pseudoxanthomonas jiangsuensis]|uniref:type II secretion system protein n=1 Tax=Pseudoxanthomonas jiangsuensis TaxID=619688 RepID=UPI001391755A|nr:type II secretion system protein [Pseudoxanthomonas jiangsuensis]
MTMPGDTRQQDAGPHARRQGGFSLLELTVALVILGIIGVLLVRWIQLQSSEREQVVQRDLLQRADDAVMGFAAIQSRLPCPDADADGREDCAGTLAVGSLPYVTLGLPDRRATAIRYGVLRRTGTLTVPEWDDKTSSKAVDADLAHIVDRAQTLQVIANSKDIRAAARVQSYDNCDRLSADAPTCDDLPQLRDNGLDFCEAIRDASLLPASSGFLHTLQEDAPTAMAGNVAYALAMTDRLAPSPQHVGGSLAFHSPRRPSAGDYHDKVRAVGLDQLWTRLRCGESYGAAIYAHANVAVAARLATPAMHDYQEQLAIMYDLAVANDLSADAGLVAAAAQITSATAGVLDTIGETFETYGAWNWRVAVATVGIGSAVGGMVAAGVMKAYATTYKNRSRDLLQEFSTTDNYPSLAGVLEEAVTTEARRADMLGLFPDAAVRDSAVRFDPGAATATP